MMLHRSRKLTAELLLKEQVTLHAPLPVRIHSFHVSFTQVELIFDLVPRRRIPG
jgi:L-rhamnose isomerase